MATSEITLTEAMAKIAQAYGDLTDNTSTTDNTWNQLERFLDDLINDIEDEFVHVDGVMEGENVYRQGNIIDWLNSRYNDVGDYSG